MDDSSHRFAEAYRGPVAFGLSREVDEDSLVVYLQKFSDDRLMETLKSRLTDDEIRQTHELIIRLLHNHLSHEEYHRLFLREKEMK